MSAAATVPTGRVALVTGASRGVGAETAGILAGRGAAVIVNYRDKAARAQRVVDAIRASGGEATAVRADITDASAVSAMAEEVRHRYGRLNALVLNASGGLERDVDAGYALRLNRDAQLAVLDAVLPLMPAGGRVVFVTSHEAHFHGTAGAEPVAGRYAPVARSKRAGEDALRARIPELARHGIGLTVVSGDMIVGTVTVTLLDRAEPGLLAARREQAGAPLPTVPEFAAAVADAVSAPAESGHTVFVGGTDYLAAGS